MIVCQVRYARSEDGVHEDLLDAGERARLSGIRRPADRCRFVAGRHLAKALVAEMLDIDPVAIRVRTRCVHCGSREHGKPFAVHPEGTRPLSIAHSGAIVLVASTSGPEVGVDVETIDEGKYSDRLLGQIEALDERGSTPRDARSFTQLWSYKEAILKCTGDGLMVCPKSFSIDLSRSEPRVVGWPAGRSPPPKITPIHVQDDYTAALAIATDHSVALTVQKGT